MEGSRIIYDIDEFVSKVIEIHEARSFLTWWEHDRHYSQHPLSQWNYRRNRIRSSVSFRSLLGCALKRGKSRKTQKNHRRSITATCVPQRSGGEGEREREKGGAGEGERERERGTMSYPNEHVAPKTLSSCSVPRNPPNHVDYVVRRSRRTDPCRAHAPLCVRAAARSSKVARLRPRGDDGTDLIALIRQTELGREVNALSCPQVSIWKFFNLRI